MEKSQTISKLATALIAFQIKADKISKDSSNPFFKSKYASLSHIQEAIQIPLAESGLAYSQLPDGENGLTTILIHAESGEYLQSTYDMAPVKNDPQGRGSAITYQKRYSLTAILGLNIDEDDDANAASKVSESKPVAKIELPWLNPNTEKWTKALEALQQGYTIDKIKAKYQITKANETQLLNQLELV
jgi:hypothetical protein